MADKDRCQAHGVYHCPICGSYKLVEVKTEEVKRLYSLNCDQCGESFKGSSGFPYPPLCPKCRKPKTDKTNRDCEDKPESPMYLGDGGQWEVHEPKPEMCPVFMPKRYGKHGRDEPILKSCESKPDESRLLTDEEFADAQMDFIKKYQGLTGRALEFPLRGELRDECNRLAQDAKTAPIIKQECAQEKVDFAASVYAEAICMARVECQQRVEGIKREIERIARKETVRVSGLTIGSPESTGGTINLADECCIIPINKLDAIWKKEGL